MSTSEQELPRSGAQVSGDVPGKAPEAGPFDPPARNGSGNGASGEKAATRPAAPSLSSQLSSPLPSSRPSPPQSPGGATQQMPSVPPSARPYSAGAPGTAASPYSAAPVPVGQQATGVMPPNAQRGLPQPQGQAPAPHTAPRHQPRPTAGVQRASGPRKVRLNVAKVDPFSVLKLSFLVSVGIGVATVIAAIVVWQVLNGMGVFSEINRLAHQIAGDSTTFDVNDYVGLGKVVSLATVIAVINVALLTALSTLGAFLYNLSSGLVGGLHVTLSDD